MCLNTHQTAAISENACAFFNECDAWPMQHYTYYIWLCVNDTSFLSLFRPLFARCRTKMWWTSSETSPTFNIICVLNFGMLELLVLFSISLFLFCSCSVIEWDTLCEHILQLIRITECALVARNDKFGFIEVLFYKHITNKQMRWTRISERTNDWMNEKRRTTKSIEF